MIDRRKEPRHTGSRRTVISRPPGIITELYEARQRLSLTQMSLATIIGTTATSLCQWETGTHVPSYLNLIAWANALNYDLILKDRR